MWSALAIVAVPVLLVTGSLALATKLTFPMLPWTAIVGMRRVAFSNGDLTWVSRGVLMPTAVFWYGVKDDQRERVAKAMAEGLIPRRSYGGASVREYEGSPFATVWPDERTRSLLGASSDSVLSGKVGVL